MQTCYQNTRITTLLILNIMFSECSDNMSAWNVIRKSGKQYLLHSKCCSPYVLTTFHADMFQNTKKTTLSKPNVSETIVITVICAEMFSGPMENNTFQAQSVRNQCNHNYVYFPGCLLQPPANLFDIHPSIKKTTQTNCWRWSPTLFVL